MLCLGVVGLRRGWHSPECATTEPRLCLRSSLVGSLLEVCRRCGYLLGTQIGLGWGEQNERDRAMVKDPPIDFEEVVVGIGSLGSIPRPVGRHSRRFFQFMVLHMVP
jgi:hypothetical protein